MVEQGPRHGLHESLLDEAVRTKRQKAEGRESVERAREYIPEIRERIERLIDFKNRTNEEPEDPNNPSFIKSGERMVITEEGSRRLAERLQRSRTWENGSRVSKSFTIPAGNDDELEILLYRSKYDAVIDVADLDRILRIDTRREYGVIESRAHKHRSFDMHTPIGPSSDLGPVWSREVNMEDIDSYRDLLNGLESLQPSQEL